MPVDRRTRPVGDLTPHLTLALMRRFWSRVDTSGGVRACWEWRGSGRSTSRGLVSRLREMCVDVRIDAPDYRMRPLLSEAS